MRIRALFIAAVAAAAFAGSSITAYACSMQGPPISAMINGERAVIAYAGGLKGDQPTDAIRAITRRDDGKTVVTLKDGKKLVGGIYGCYRCAGGPAYFMTDEQKERGNIPNLC